MVDMLPPNTGAVIGYYRHITSSDGGANNVDLNANLFLFRTFFLMKFGQHFQFAPIAAVLPVADVTVIAPTPLGLNAVVHGSGMGDFVYVPNFVYTLRQSEASSFHMAFSPYVFMPTGTYNDERPINIGTHRWKLQPEIYIGQQFAKIFSLEAVGNFQYITNNNDYVVPANGQQPFSGKTTLHQRPGLAGELHAMMDVTPYLGLGLSYYVASNGRIYHDLGSPQCVADCTTVTPHQVIHSLKGTWAIKIEKFSLLLLQYQHDIAASGGASIGQYVGARFTHLFFL
jgi:hypothetical protein